MENQELIKQVTEKAEKWLTPAYDAETQAEVHRLSGPAYEPAFVQQIQTRFVEWKSDVR